MKKLLSLCIALFSLATTLEAADGIGGISDADSQKSKLLFYEDQFGSRTGIQQFYDILNQLEHSMGDIPPEIERVAVYNLRVDRNEYSTGMAKFFQGKIEETFSKYGRRQIVVAPELRTTRVTSTDTSFQLTNTLPSQEELWRIGEKLRLDGFIEGSLTRSDAGDVVLNLKIFKHKSADVVWSGSFIAGPNERKLSFPYMEFGVRLSLGFWPVEKFTSPSDTLSGNSLGLSVYQYGAEITIGEAANSLRRLYLSAAGGIMVLVTVPDDPRDSVVGNLENYYTATAGADLLYVFVPKKDSDDGYWLGAYGGVRTYLPQKLIMLRHGYTSRITRHFSISAGVQFMPLLNQLVSDKSLLSANEYELLLQNPNFEISIQYAL